MKLSKTLQILLGTLFLGIACASAQWLFWTPRDRGMTDAQARKIGYASAAQKEEAHALYTAVRKSKSISPSQAMQISDSLKSEQPSLRLKALLTLDVIGEQSRDATEHQKAVTLALAAVHHPSPDMRVCVAMTLVKFADDARARAAIEAMTHDSESQVREYAIGAMKSMQNGPAWKGSSL